MRNLLFFLLALPLMAPAQEPAPTIRTTTNEVLLDFVVRDKHANTIKDLRPDEVQVFEDGVLQPLRHFEFLNGHSVQEAVPVPQPASPVPGSPSANAPAEPHTVNELRDISVVSLVIADLDPRGRKVTLDSMRQFVNTEMRPNTYVGVFALGLGGLVDIQPYTNNAEKITAAVDRVAAAANISQLTNTSQLSDPNTMFGSPDPSSPIPVGSADPNSPVSTVTYGESTASAVGPAAAIAQFMDTSWVSEMQDVYQESTHILTPLRMLVEAQANIPGRKVVLLLSAGLPVQVDTADFLKGVISAANRANVTFYAVDTLGFTSQSTLDNSRRLLQHAAQASRQMQLARVTPGADQTVTPSMVIAADVAASSIHGDTMGNLAELSEGTGGELLPPSLDLREPLRRVMEDVQSHYELAYSPANTQMDGNFRKIEIKVSRKGAVVFTRSGYFAVPKLNGRDIYPFEIATLKALNIKPQMHQFAFHAAALQFRPGPQQTQLSFVFQAPARDLTITKDGQWLKIQVDVTALVKDDKGQVVSKISRDIPYEEPLAKLEELKRGVVSFTSAFFLAPGHYTMEIAAVDRLSMKASVSRIALVVTPDSGLSMSDVEVARRVDPVHGGENPAEPLQAHGGLVTPELSDTVQPDAEGKVTLYAVAYPRAPIDAPIGATLELWRDGRLMMKSPASDVPPDATGAASILAALKTEKLPPGQYNAQVSFEYKGQKVAKMIAFTLAGAS